MEMLRMAGITKSFFGVTVLDNVDFSALSPVEQRMLQMFYVTVWGKVAEDWKSDEV